jgi:pimeloyl-ACP methyl ester carboxylesterase
MTEKVFRFGPADSLLGILTEPAEAAPAPAMLWLNAGMVHHVGPFGWYVTLARRLADQGFLSFRIDVSGVGESPNRSDKRAAEERAAHDVRAAMDFLARKRQVEQFVLIGVCSGAMISHRVAVQDSRVVGAAMLDGYAYPTPGFTLRRYGRRLFRLKSWLSAAKRLLPALFPHKPDPVYLTGEFFLLFPPRDQVRADLANLLNRGVQCLFLYTGGMADLHFNHRRQFREMFGNLDPSGERLQCDYLAQSDHLFSAHAHRQHMFERIQTWTRRFQTTLVPES